MTKIEFIEWLKKQIESRNWSQAEFARQTNLSPAQVTRLLNGERGVGENGIIAIAHAFKLSPEAVFRAAGILPQQTANNETIEQINYLTKELPTDEQQGILEFVKMRHRLAEERGKNEPKRTRNKPAIP